MTRGIRDSIRAMPISTPELLPATESLKDTLERVRPFWETRIIPQLAAGRDVLLVAHGNSLRALVKMLDRMSETRHRRIQHPDRRSDALRAGRATAAAQPALSRRSRRDRRRPGCGAAPGREKVSRASGVWRDRHLDAARAHR